MDIKLKLEEIKARFDQSGELSSSEKKFIESHYERVLSKTIRNRGCNQCLEDAFIEMYVHSKKYGIKDMGKFTLKREVVRFIDNVPYSRANMTDKVAVKLLKQYPQRIEDFEEYPEEWEQIINQSPEKSNKKESKKTTPKAKKDDDINQSPEKSEVISE